ncbi:MAG: class B sortase [Clostridia bacterium]|nr:class B sortase [Clostridia bacterium]
MANNKRNTPAGQGNEMDELLRMLDSIEGRTLDDEVEETIRRYGAGASGAYVPPEKGFNPDQPQSDLADILINPDDMDEETEDTMQQAAQLLDSNTEENMVEDMPPPPEQRRNPLAVIGQFFANNWPRKGDGVGSLVRKCAFWLSLLVLVGCLVYLVYDVVIQPNMNAQLYAELQEVYKPEPIGQETIVTGDANYPEGMLASFKELYKRNPEVSGWLSFHAAGTDDFLNIEYPVMYSGDNEKYALVDFYGDKNKNGCLFLDSRNKITSPADMDRCTIIYGHNMASGQMFAGLNRFIGNEKNARLGTTLTFSTLYSQDVYEVFAVCLSDVALENTAVHFNYWRAFEDKLYEGTAEEIEAQRRWDFGQYLEAVRARSLFDYPTQVSDEDSILILSSCTGRTSAHLNDGRVLVFARRVPKGEEPTLNKSNASQIVKNTDVLMPYSWYVNQGEKIPAYYAEIIGSANTTIPVATTTTTAPTTTPTESTTTTTVPTSTTTTTAPTSTTTTTESTTTTTESTTTTTESTTTTTTTEPTETTTTTEPLWNEWN